jgi:hypothetical protein
MNKVNPMRFLKFHTLALLCVSIAFGTAFAPAQAKWVSKKKKAEQQAIEKVQTFQPPPADAVTRYCEPFRAEAVDLSKKPKLVRVFYEPRRMWLMNQHQKCRMELMDQEHVYLKHADIEQPPNLPKIKTDPPKPGAPNGNLP